MLAVVTVAGLVLSLQGPQSLQPAPTTAPIRKPASPVVTDTGVTATRAATAPTIDGKDDDAVWREAPAITEFTEWQPNEGKQPRFKTEAKVAYDAANLYVFVRSLDPHPDSIMRALSRRDVRGPSDQVKVMIDSYNDERSGYEFAVNPDGVKRDYAMTNDGNEDISWNGVWDVGTVVDSLG